jgi:hypothetical protein
VNTHPVSLLKVPVVLWLTLQEHTDALSREYRLILQAPPPPAPPPWMDLLREVHDLFPRTAVPYLRGHVQAAYEAGLDVTDLIFEAVADEVLGMERLHQLLCEIDDYCREGVLLSLPLADDGLALRDWVVREAARQVRHGGPPAVWPKVTERA